MSKMPQDDLIDVPDKIFTAESYGMARMEPARRDGDDMQTISFELYIGRAIRIMRTKRKLRQADLAELLNAVLDTMVDQPYISDVESGKTGVSLNRLATFATVLDCPTSLLVEWAETIAEKESRSEAVNVADLVLVSKSELSRRGVAVDLEAELVNKRARARLDPEAAPVNKRARAQ